jgi:hypothetical protein
MSLATRSIISHIAHSGQSRGPFLFGRADFHDHEGFSSYSRKILR